MSIKMESELHDQFMAVAASEQQPAVQIVRDPMSSYIERQGIILYQQPLPRELGEHLLKMS